MISANLPAIRQPCSLPRRLGAIFYDTLLLLSILFFFTFLLIPFNSWMAIDHGNIPYNICLLLISYFYFTWQWTHGGQTLGMLAWKIKVIDELTGTDVSWRKASFRFVLGILSFTVFAAGFIWTCFDTDRLAFHDRYSGTRLILVS